MDLVYPDHICPLWVILKNGYFFLGKYKKLICDDLTIRPYTLKTLRSLCDLLLDRVVLK